LHALAEARADVVAPIGPGPAAVLESAVAVLVLSAGRLHDAVERHELGDDELSHMMVFGEEGRVVCRRTVRGWWTVFICTSNEPLLDRHGWHAAPADARCSPCGSTRRHRAGAPIRLRSTSPKR